MLSRLTAADVLVRLRRVRPAPLAVTGASPEERARARVRARLYVGGYTVDAALALGWRPVEAVTGRLMMTSSWTLPWTRGGRYALDDNPLAHLRPIAAGERSPAAAYSP